MYIYNLNLPQSFPGIQENWKNCKENVRDEVHEINCRFEYLC